MPPILIRPIKNPIGSPSTIRAIIAIASFPISLVHSLLDDLAGAQV
jgi:hypothetical protein